MASRVRYARRFASAAVGATPSSNLVRDAGEQILRAKPKMIALSGPAGFLGSRVLDAVLDAQEFRRREGVDPGEALLLSASPGNLMSRLTAKYGLERLKSVRASGDRTA
jgi:hypothetical protein